MSFSNLLRPSTIQYRVRCCQRLVNGGATTTSPPNAANLRCSGGPSHSVVQRRDLFQLPNLPGPLRHLSGKTIDYSEKKLVGYSMEQMYDVVSGIENYQEFIPWCTSSTVLHRSATAARAELVIGFPPVTESFLSSVTFRRPHFVRAECRDGKLFQHMVTTWRFYPGLGSNDRSCTAELSVSFQFCSTLHYNLARAFLDEVVHTMTDAFLQRARVIHGMESIKSQPTVDLS